MKTNLFKIMLLALFLLPLLGRGLGGGCALLAQTDLSVCYGKGYTLTSTAAAPPFGATSYSWQEKVNDGAFSEVSGETGALLHRNANGSAGTYAYVRMASNAECPDGVPSNTFTVWVYPAFSPGSITTASKKTQAGMNPSVTIANSATVTGGSGNITYQWRRTGTSSATLTGANATYTLSTNASGNYGTAGTYYFNRYAKDATCNTAWLAAAGTYTLVVENASPPSGIASTLCTQCCYDDSTWVDCYVTTGTLGTAQWIGNSNQTYFAGASGTGSDKDGRKNFTAITSSTVTIAANSAVGLCKALGDGWYLPAYEELYNMRTGTATSYGNGLDGAKILTDGWHWSSTEYYGNLGRRSGSLQSSAVVVSTTGLLGFDNKSTAYSYVRCAWRQ